MKNASIFSNWFSSSLVGMIPRDNLWLLPFSVLWLCGKLLEAGCARKTWLAQFFRSDGATDDCSTSEKSGWEGAGGSRKT